MTFIGKKYGNLRKNLFLEIFFSKNLLDLIKSLTFVVKFSVQPYTAASVLQLFCLIPRV